MGKKNENMLVFILFIDLSIYLFIYWLLESIKSLSSS